MRSKFARVYVGKASKKPVRGELDMVREKGVGGKRAPSPREREIRDGRTYRPPHGGWGAFFSQPSDA